ncbi:MAG TPA: PEGA domain-containing protein [Candidatus Saccharimonadales bacterium]|nr:PEGA domain-containing protein [Candidatus Saccharimonadales bacterium]
MDFLDPEKQKKHAIRLIVGYALIGAVLVLATTILLHRAYGFGLDREGRVIQNGLLFVSSRPGGADIYVNGQRYRDQTNTRMALPAGQYTIELRRDGYRNWKRVITAEGSSVSRFDYPFLFPSAFTPDITKQYSAAPGLATQSLDRRWLLVQTPTANEFDIYDLNAEKPIARPVRVPADILAADSTTQGWQVLEWARDDRHVLLRRLYRQPATTGREYILFDRENPQESQNLTVTLGFNPTTIELRSRNWDQYYAHDANSGVLFTATLKKPTPQPYLQDVLAFTSDEDRVLYATSQSATAGNVAIRLRQGDRQAYTLRQLPTGTNYVLDLATYERTLYAAAGAASENRVFVYRDPFKPLADKQPAVPVHILKVANPTYTAFSISGRFVMAESGDRFAVYDAETDKNYAYQTKVALDTPQLHATWMDGFHLAYVGGGKLVVLDFDGANQQSLMPASAAYIPFFDPDYRAVYTITPQHALTNTPLLTPRDR